MKTQNQLERTIERRLSQITECQFQAMIDGVPYYHFSDLETGIRYEGLAYGTEANRLRYQLKAELEKQLRLAARTAASFGRSTESSSEATARSA